MMSVRRWLNVLSLVLLGTALAASTAWGKGKKSHSKGKAVKKPQSTEAAAMYVPPYGMAGCGLGSLVFKDDSKGTQIAGATVNATGLQSFVILSSQSSNCKEQATGAALSAEQQVFVAANLRALEEEVSAGGGAYTQAFAQVLGCDGGVDYDEFLQTSRRHYQQIFTSDDAVIVYAQYMRALRANPKLTARCERVTASS